MASDSGPCCGHDHVGGDELWMTRDELREMIRDELRELTSAGGQLAAAGKPAAPGAAPAAAPVKAPAAPTTAPASQAPQPIAKRMGWLDRPVGRRSRSPR